MPSLDLKLYTGGFNGKKQITHKFYSKDVSSKAVFNAESELPLQKALYLELRSSTRSSKLLPERALERGRTARKNMVLRMQKNRRRHSRLQDEHNRLLPPQRHVRPDQ